MGAKSGISYNPVFFHTAIGMAIGYFLLHPITMVIYWIENTNNSLTFSNIEGAFSEAFMKAFYFHMMPMSIAFIIIGGIIGFFSGISFNKIRKQGHEIRLQQNQLNLNLEKLASLNESLEKKVSERTIQLKESKENLEVLTSKLLDLDKAKTEFMNLISHEIRTPLNGIIGSLELLKKSEYADKIQELVEILDSSVKRFEEFTMNALLITRLKTKYTEIKSERVFLSSLIREVLDEEKKVFQSRNLLFNEKDGISQISVLGEDSLIKKCILYILENAVFCSPINSAIRINTYKENTAVICEIENEGQGYTAKEFNQVFELFTPGNEYQDNYLGIGLPIAKMIMLAHGGNLLISITPDGNGTIVKLLFLKFEDMG